MKAPEPSRTVPNAAELRVTPCCDSSACASTKVARPDAESAPSGRGASDLDAGDVRSVGPASPRASRASRPRAPKQWSQLRQPRAPRPAGSNNVPAAAGVEVRDHDPWPGAACHVAPPFVATSTPATTSLPISDVVPASFTVRPASPVSFGARFAPPTAFLAPRSRRHGIRCRQWTGPPADRRRPLHGATFTPLSWRGFEDASSTQSRRNRDDRVRRCERRDTVRTRKHCESAAGFAREVLHNSLYAVIALAAFISLALSFIAANARLDQKERELRRHIARRTPIRTNRSQTKDRASV